MSDPFIAEIRMVGFSFAPRGWATCDGQLLPISQNTALFSLLGTYYGGDGKTTFALPDLQGASPMHWGQGPGLSTYSLGESGGTETVTLLANEDGSHGHGVTASGGAASSLDADGRMFTSGSNAMYMPAADTALDPGVVKTFGGGGPHNNRQPYLTVLFIIAMQGVYPPRS